MRQTALMMVNVNRKESRRMHGSLFVMVVLGKLFEKTMLVLYIYTWHSQMEQHCGAPVNGAALRGSCKWSRIAGLL